MWDNEKEPNTMRDLYELGLLREMDIQIVSALVRTFCKDVPPPDDKIQTLLALAIRATADGHVCLYLGQENWSAFARPRRDGDIKDESFNYMKILAQLPPPTAVNDLLTPWRKILVGDGTGPEPFVLERNRLYLRRFWNYEKRVAEKLKMMSRKGSHELSEEAEAAIESLMLSAKPAEEPKKPSAGQKGAIRKAAGRHLTIITGGPGTGKTTVAALLLRLLASQLKPSEPLRVRMAAPTGKAAARLDESIREELHGAEAFLDLEPASTIERLLGFRQNSPYFRHNRDNPLPADVLLIDEASMIDLPKMAKLLDGLAEKTRLVLLGDKDQLASVDPGSVMAELCQSESLKDCVAVLSENHRFGEDSAITPLSKAVNDGDGDKAWAIAKSDVGVPGKKISIRDSARFHGKELPKEFKESVVDGYRSFLAAKTPKEAFEELAKFRVLCALRSGPQGVDSINRAIEDLLLPNRRGEFYDHQVVLVTKNDYEIKLFNGDIGVVLPDTNDRDKLIVYFEIGPDSFRSVPCRMLPEHELGFAMTVHKSQGSGFGRVLVLLPNWQSPISTRELIYTAITRTKTGADLWCEENSFKSGVARQTERSMGLNERLDADENGSA